MKKIALEKIKTSNGKGLAVQIDGKLVEATLREVLIFLMDHFDSSVLPIEMANGSYRDFYRRVHGITEAMGIYDPNVEVQEIELTDCMIQFIRGLFAVDEKDMHPASEVVYRLFKSNTFDIIKYIPEAGSVKKEDCK